jgi:uncharacterized damage-inducible protein DinB
MDPKLIDQYGSGGAKLLGSIAGLSRQDLLWVPPAEARIGRWSIQQIVIHLMDSDLIWSSRMKSIIAEDNPAILSFDENKFVASLFYEDQNAESAAGLLDLNRRQFAKVLRKLPDSSFSRTGWHSERGTIALREIVQLMVEHIDHHLGFISKKREKLAKPLKD